MVPATAAAMLAIAAVVISGCARPGGDGAGSPAGSPGRAASRQGAAHAGHAGQSGGPGATGHVGTIAHLPARGPRLCADPAAVLAVRVTRLPPLSQMGQARPVPARRPVITIRDVGRVRALARVICGLPLMPRGVLSCPVDLGGGFQLVFATAARWLPAVVVQASGCEVVTGASPGRQRWTRGARAFWTAFARLTGIEAPAHAP